MTVYLIETVKNSLKHQETVRNRVETVTVTYDTLEIAIIIVKTQEIEDKSERCPSPGNFQYMSECVSQNSLAGLINIAAGVME